jgi:putative hydrolase of the HAD superfamily
MDIVFDLGGVVVRWDPDGIVASVFSDAATRSLVRREVFSHSDWLDLDRGTRTAEDVIHRAADRTGLPASAMRTLLDAVPPSLVLIPDTVDLLYRLKAKGHRLYCLSNMNAASIAYLERTHDFWSVFTGQVISSRILMCKPDPRIYAHLLDAFALAPATTVFIDDVASNLVGAEHVGIRTILFENAAQCEQDVESLIARHG